MTEQTTVRASMTALLLTASTIGLLSAIVMPWAAFVTLLAWSWAGDLIYALVPALATVALVAVCAVIVRRVGGSAVIGGLAPVAGLSGPAAFLTVFGVDMLASPHVAALSCGPVAALVVVIAFRRTRKAGLIAAALLVASMAAFHLVTTTSQERTAADARLKEKAAEIKRPYVLTGDYTEGEPSPSYQLSDMTFHLPGGGHIHVRSTAALNRNLTGNENFTLGICEDDQERQEVTCSVNGAPWLTLEGHDGATEADLAEAVPHLQPMPDDDFYALMRRYF